jgi:hypothetical protein
VLPDKRKSFECYPTVATRIPTLGGSKHSKSQTRYMIIYHGCPILWASQLQSVFALSSTEAKYVALSTALQDVILVMELLKEMEDHGYDVKDIPLIKCKLFEDNSGGFAKYQPRTCHINAAWHHIRLYMANGLIQVHSIYTDCQLGDTFTKQGFAS